MTILHVSDMQFGKYHRFGVSSQLHPDATFDTLLQRLTDDLTYLETDRGLKPEVIVASGDQAEWGLPSEFEQAHKFLEGLTDHLGLKSASGSSSFRGTTTSTGRRVRLI